MNLMLIVWYYLFHIFLWPWDRIGLCHCQRMPIALLTISHPEFLIPEQKSVPRARPIRSNFSSKAAPQPTSTTRYRTHARDQPIKPTPRYSPSLFPRAPSTGPAAPSFLSPIHQLPLRPRAAQRTHAAENHPRWRRLCAASRACPAPRRPPRPRPRCSSARRWPARSPPASARSATPSAPSRSPTTSAWLPPPLPLPLPP